MAKRRAQEKAALAGLYAAFGQQFPRLKKALTAKRYELEALQGQAQKAIGTSPFDLDNLDWSDEERLLTADLEPVFRAVLREAVLEMALEHANLGVQVSWEVYNAKAAEYARQYSYGLIKQINDSTRTQMGQTIGRWIESGETFPQLTDRIWKLVPANPFPNMRDRAQVIAATETTRVFADTQRMALSAAGLKRWRWRSAEDEAVCFPALTQVQTETGPKSIEDIRPGEMVHTRYGLRRVIATHKRRYSGEMVTIKAGRYSVTATANHPFWTLEEGWLDANKVAGHTLQTFGNEYVRGGAILNVGFGQTQDLPAVRHKIGGFVPISSFVLVPVGAINLNGYPHIGQEKVNTIPAHMRLLDKGKTHHFQGKSDGSFQSILATETTITAKGTELLAGRTWATPKRLTAMEASDDCGGASAFLRTVMPVPASFCARLERLSTSFAFLKYDRGMTAFQATHGESVFDTPVNRKRLPANRADLIHLVGTVGVVAGSATEVSVERELCTSSRLSALLAQPFGWLGVDAIAFLRTKPIHVLPLGLSRSFKLLTTNTACILKRHVKQLLSDLHALYHQLFAKSITVYNLQVEEHPEYYANGLLVHNCPICGPMGMADGGEGAIGETTGGTFLNPSTGDRVSMPAHPACRCFAVADTTELEELAGMSPEESPPTKAEVEAAVEPATAAAEPAAVVTGPMGTPVSGALTLPKSGKYATRYHETLDIIDSVHGDGDLPALSITTSNSDSKVAARYRFQGKQAIGIGVNTNAKFVSETEASLTHEIGHFIDHQGIGRTGVFASEIEAVGGPLMPWWDAVEESRAYKVLREKQLRPSKFGVPVQIGGVTIVTHPDWKEVNYLLDRREIWARSYVQYIAERSGDPRLLKSIDKDRMHILYGEKQWSPEDFAPIAAAIDQVFRGLRWLR